MALVDYVFVAEFDIDKGSSLRHALPGFPAGYDGDSSSRIAELMLPDGAHNRMAESTTFMLRAKGQSASSDDPAAAETQTELRCFSIARTRIDASRRRHADLKALAIASRMPFADMFRPALAAALDCYFSSPMLATLQSILAAFNSLDISGFKLPSRTERTLLRGVLPLQGRSAAFLYPPSLSAFLAGADAAAVATAALPAAAAAVSPSAAAAAVAVAAATGEPVPATITGSPTEADAAAAAQREAHWFWSPSLTLTFPAAAPVSGDASSADARLPAASDVTSPASAAAPVRVPLSFRYPRFLEPSAFHSAPLAALLRRFGDRTADIMAAVLLEKRVLFLGGRDVPAADVCACVLATAHMVCPPLSGTALSRRLYPYANLTDLSFLDTKGYIAGVTNPLFETKTGWFDVLCVLSGDGAGGSAGGVIEVGGSAGGAGAAAGSAASGAVGPIGGGRPILPTGAGTPHALGPAAAGTGGGSPALSGAANPPGGAAPPVPSSVAFSPAGEVFFAGIRTAATRDADAAFLASLRSGARFGEQWLRQAFQAHAAHWVQLAGLHELIVGGRAGRARTSTFGSALGGVAAAAAVAAAAEAGHVPAVDASSTSEHLKPLAEGEGEDGLVTAPGGADAGDHDAAVGIDDAATGLASPAASASSASADGSASGSVASGASATASWQPLRSRAESAAWTFPSGGRSSLSFGAGAGGLGGLGSPVHRSYPLLVSAAQRAQVLGASSRLRALAATATYEATRRERASEEMAICLGEQPLLFTQQADVVAASKPADAAVAAVAVDSAGEADAPATAAAASAGAQPVDCSLLRSIARLLRQPGVLARTAPDCEPAAATPLGPAHSEKASHSSAIAAADGRVALGDMPLPYSPASGAGGPGTTVAAAAAAITGLASAAAGAAAAGGSAIAQLASDIAALLRGSSSGTSTSASTGASTIAAAAAKPTVNLVAGTAGSASPATASEPTAAAAAHGSSPAAAVASSTAASQAPCPLRLFTDLHASLRGNPSAQIYFLACLLADGSLPATGDVGGSSVGNGMAGGGEGGLGVGGIAGGSPGLHPLASAALHASPGVRAAARGIIRELACHPWLPVRAAIASTNSELLRVVRQGNGHGAEAAAAGESR